MRTVLDVLSSMAAAVFITAFFYPEFAIGLASFLKAHAAAVTRSKKAYVRGWRSVRSRKPRETSDRPALVARQRAS
jgi:hypothetical protein